MVNRLPSVINVTSCRQFINSIQNPVNGCNRGFFFQTWMSERKRMCFESLYKDISVCDGMFDSGRFYSSSGKNSRSNFLFKWVLSALHKINRQEC